MARRHSFPPLELVEDEILSREGYGTINAALTESAGMHPYLND